MGTVGRRASVLFLCSGNACRSQMAEGWARHLLGTEIETCSAGIEPHGLDPRAVQAMAEAGVDISFQRSKHLGELAGRDFDYVITVCDHAHESCPVFPGGTHMMHRGFPDPPRLAAGARSEEEALDHYRRVRDEIRDYVAGLPGVLAKDARSGQVPPAGEAAGNR